MKKMIVSICLFITILTFTIQPVSADIGPKATAEVNIKGVEGNYSFELLIEVTNEIRFLEPEEVEDYAHYGYYLETYPERLVNFQDDDGYAACTFYNGPPCYYRQTGENSFKMTYFYAPRNFKVAIVTEDDVLIVSESINRQMFQAEFTYDLTGVDLTVDQFGVGVLTEDLPIPQALGGFFVRLVLTIGIEVGILALFMYKSKASYKLVGAVNLISQTLLSFGILIGYYYFSFFGALAIFLIGEIFVFTFEMVVYALKLKEKSLARAVTYGFVANMVTLLLTFILIILEGIIYA